MVEIEPTRLEAWMDAALDEARAALAHDDVPVGAVVVDLTSDRIVTARHNERELTNDPTAHAELLAVRDAAAAAGTWRLDDHALVVTLEPCPMCAGAVWAARIPLVVFGAADPKAGASGQPLQLRRRSAAQPHDRGRRRGARRGVRGTAHRRSSRREGADARRSP